MNHDLNTTALAVVSACVIIWGLVSARLERWDVSAPMAFVVLGVVSPTARRTSTTSALLDGPRAGRGDARPRALRRRIPGQRASPAGRRRLSGAAPGHWSPPHHRRRPRHGRPSSRAAGSGWPPSSPPPWRRPTPPSARPSWGTMSPLGVRRLINVESGLNDGIATPFVSLFIAGAATARPSVAPLSTAVVELLGGAGIGVGLGVVGAVIRALADGTGGARLSPGRPRFSRSRCSPIERGPAGTNGFIAAFVAGMALAPWTFKRRGLAAFTEETGGPLAPGLVHLRGDHARPGLRGPGGATSCSPCWPSPSYEWCRSRSRWPDRARSPHRGLRGLVRPPRARLGRLRPDRLRCPGTIRIEGGPRRGDPDRRSERASPRRDRVPIGRSLRRLRRAPRSGRDRSTPGRRRSPRATLRPTLALTRPPGPGALTIGSVDRTGEL